MKPNPAYLRIFRLYGNEYVVEVISVMQLNYVWPKSKVRVLWVLSDPCPILRDSARVGHVMIADGETLYAPVYL